MRTMEELYKDMEGDDDRPGVQELLRDIKRDLPVLEELLQSTEKRYEDGIYRFYSGSVKVTHLRDTTREIVQALSAIAPQRKLDTAFLAIVKEATPDDDPFPSGDDWLKEARPIVEGFLHARYFLEMAVRYGKALDSAPRMFPSGWAALLCLYGLR